MADIYQLCAATVYQDGAFCVPQASIQLPLSDSDSGTEDPVDLGQLIIANALGVTALPAAPNSDGTAEGVVIEGIGGMNGVFVSGWDVRSADVAGELSPGDTCLHGTHSDATKRARFFCKEGLASIVIGSGDLIFTMNQADEEYTMLAWGNVIQITPDSVKLSQGGVDGSPVAWIELKGGAISAVGAVNAGGDTALPLVQSPGLVAALGVVISALTSIGAAPVTGSVLSGLLATLSASVVTAATTKQMSGA
jgi:hypothetical protein